MGPAQRENPGATARRGELLYFWGETEQERLEGRLLIQRAALRGDAHGRYLLGMILWGEAGEPFRPRAEALWARYLWQAAVAGHKRARETLDRFCALRCPAPTPVKGPLTDCDGNRLELRRAGALMPVKGELRYEKGENILTLRVNIAFFYTLEPEERELFEEAVLAGIRDWEGVYTVFGGQTLRLRMELTRRDRLFGSVIVMPMAEDVHHDARKLAGKILPEKKREKALSVLDHRRSFAVSGLKWSLRSPKFITLQAENGAFTDADAIRHIAKHEFGHVLGLGDLYASAVDGYPGVPFGTHPALDGFSIQNGYYYLVMCDHRGPVSGKDVEMVLLAFREGRMQLYQKAKPKDRVSEALHYPF